MDKIRVYLEQELIVPIIDQKIRGVFTYEGKSSISWNPELKGRVVEFPNHAFPYDAFGGYHSDLANEALDEVNRVILVVNYQYHEHLKDIISFGVLYILLNTRGSIYNPGSEDCINGVQPVASYHPDYTDVTKFFHKIDAAFMKVWLARLKLLNKMEKTEKTGHEWAQSIRDPERREAALAAFLASVKRGTASKGDLFPTLSKFIDQGFLWLDSKAQNKKFNWPKYYQRLRNLGLVLVVALLALSSSAQISYDVSYRNLPKETMVARANYHVGPTQPRLKFEDFTRNFKTPFFSLDLSSGEFCCESYDLCISGTRSPLQAIDQDTRTTFNRFCYGELDGKQYEYVVTLFIRFDEYYLHVVHGDIVILATGNLFLSHIFPKELWNTNQLPLTRPIMASQ